MKLKQLLTYRINILVLFEKLKNKSVCICKDKSFFISFFAIFIKILFFLILTSSDTGTSVNLKTIFYSMPPFLVYFSFITLILSFSYCFNGYSHLILLFIINIALTVLIIGDLLYYRANSSFLSMHLFNYTSNLENLSESILPLFSSIDTIYILVDILLAIYLLKNRQLYKRFKRSFSSFLLIFLISCIYLTYAHIKIDKFNKGFYNQTIFVNSWSQNQTMSNLTPIGYHLFDAYNYFKDSKAYILSDQEKENIKYYFNNKAEILPDNKYKGMLEGKNLIVLQVESLENFVIGQSINGKEITPNINKLLDNSIYFNNFVEQTHLGTTSDAELMANTSIFPVRRGSTFFRFPSNEYHSSMPNLMEGLGYNTLAVHPDRGSYWNWMPSLTSIGFNTCIDSSSLNNNDILGLGLSDKSFLRQLAEIIKKQPQPFYSFSITLTSHTPFSIPKNEVKIELPNNLKGKIIGSYIETINYTDAAIGEFIKNLNENGILENSVLVIYGDHEGPHKYFKDDFKNNSSLDSWMIDNNSKVPFIIYSKNMEGQVIKTKGGQVDILPTLSYLMGVDPKNYTYSSIGRNLLNTKYSYTYSSSGDILYNNIPDNMVKILKKSVDYSDIIIRSNYFRKE